MPLDSEAPAVLPHTHLQQLNEAREIITSEAAALNDIADSLDGSFAQAVELLISRRGNVIVVGVGKAGLIGQKIVATLASTGTRARFLHPTEAVHGDLGCVESGDTVLALSNSGSSEEVVRLLPVFERAGIPIIAITRDSQNPVAQAARVVIPIGRRAEAGDLKLAPTVSTTAMLAVGDALALVVSQARGFSAVDFAKCHPAGSLGRQLTPVREVMRSGSELRIAPATDSVRQVMVQLGRPGRRTGAVLLVDEEGKLSGIFTDSDLARLFEQRRESLIDGPISAVMTVNPLTISPAALLPEAVKQMSSRRISELPVIDDECRPLGLVDITDILDAPAAGPDEEQSAADRSAA